MYPIEVHILREESRPTGDEAQFLFDLALDSRHKQEGMKMLAEAVQSGQRLNFFTGNLTHPLMTIENSLQAFFLQNGGGRFLDDSDKYLVEAFSLGKMRSCFPAGFRYEGYADEKSVQKVMKALKRVDKLEEVGMVIVFVR
jgi:hypothetical protein